MSKKILAFLNIVLAALLAGAMFGIWIGFRPGDFSPPTYVEHQQNMIRQLNVLMPLMGLATIIVTWGAAFVEKTNKARFISLLTAGFILFGSGIITRFGNQPINELVMAWSVDSPPENWIGHRDTWWSLHILRTTLALIALGIITAAHVFGREKIN